jgi:hypothetical protein
MKVECAQISRLATMSKLYGFTFHFSTLFIEDPEVKIMFFFFASISQNINQR